MRELKNLIPPPYYTGVRVICILLLFSSILASCSSLDSISYLQEREAKYPSDKYISAQGTGATAQDAQNDALSQISLYFDTSVQVSRNLVSDYREVEIDGFYRSIEKRDIQEKAEIKSEAQFFCVQFAPSVKSGKEFYSIAFIDRESASRTLKENIRTNVSIIESLLPLAQNTQNPFYSIPAAYRGKVVADMTLALVKNLAGLSPNSNEDYSNVRELASLMQKAYQESRKHAEVSVHVIGDWNSTVKNTLAELVEKSGFTISYGEKTCSLWAEVKSNRQKNAAGVFLTPSISVTAKDIDGNAVFTYTKSFEREGAPEDYEDVAWRKSFAKIDADLRDAFAKEMSRKIGGSGAF